MTSTKLSPVMSLIVAKGFTIDVFSSRFACLEPFTNTTKKLSGNVRA